MLPHKKRLPYSEFSARGFRAVKTPHFFLKIKKNNFPHDRIGVVIGAAAVKNAARRNFWKRQAKAVLGTQPSSGRDIVIIFSKKIKEISKKEFRERLLRAISSS